jgi:glyoxylase-like metal-dependent hydrolase (beta-lactamase superfamily II)
MRRRFPIFLAVLLLASFRLTAQDAAPVIAAASKTIGGDLKSIQYSGTGLSFSLGQSPRPDTPWPGAAIKSFTAVVSYETPAMRQEIVRTQWTTPTPGVTAQTIVGEPRQILVVSGTRAWNVTGETATPAMAAVGDRLTQIWLTPHGFLKAAKESGATAKPEAVGGRKLTRISFTAHGKHTMTGLINDQHLLERIETTASNPVLGDMPIEVTFSDYKQFGGVTFPGRIVQKQGGFTTLDLSISVIQPNAPVDIQVPANVQQATVPTVTVEPQKIGDGVWYLTGGTHHSIAVEFKDHLVVIEGPQNEARSEAVIAMIKQIIPNKPIRYLVNTHHHFDHSGGIRTYAAEGATIVTHQVNRKFYERAFAAPRTLTPDRLSQSKRSVMFETVTDKKVLTDGSRTLELHHIQGSPHDAGFLMAYLPQDRILVEVDAYAPPAANAPPPATPSPLAVNLYENIKRLKLEVNAIAPLHGRLSTLADLAAAIGK